MRPGYLSARSTRFTRDGGIAEGCTSDRYFPTLNPSTDPHKSEGIHLERPNSCESLSPSFAGSLIERIRAVPRPVEDRKQIKQVSQGLAAANLKLEKSREKLECYKQGVFHMEERGKRRGAVERGRNQREQASNQMRAKIEQLLDTNEQLQACVRQLECELFFQKQKVLHLVEEIQQKERVINALEQGINIASIREQQIIDDMNEDIEPKTRQFTFKIVKTVSESFLGTPSRQKWILLKANSEIMTLKKHVSSLEKIHQNNLQEITHRKNEEINQLRKDFSQNLKYYKKMIIKCTSRKGEEIQKSDNLQSTLLDNSSIMDLLP